MKFYFCVIFALIVAAQALPAERKSRIDETGTECLAETGLSKESLQKIRKGEITPDEKTSQKLREWSFCLLKKAGYINEAGVFQNEVIDKSLAKDVEDDKTRQLIKGCLVQKSTPQETSSAYLKCAYKVVKKPKKDD